MTDSTEFSTNLTRGELGEFIAPSPQVDDPTLDAAHYLSMQDATGTKEPQHVASGPMSQSSRSTWYLHPVSFVINTQPAAFDS